MPQLAWLALLGVLVYWALLVVLFYWTLRAERARMKSVLEAE